MGLEPAVESVGVFFRAETSGALSQRHERGGPLRVARRLVGTVSEHEIECGARLVGASDLAAQEAQACARCVRRRTASDERRELGLELGKASLGPANAEDLDAIVEQAVDAGGTLPEPQGLLRMLLRGEQVTCEERAHRFDPRGAPQVEWLAKLGRQA